MENKLLFKIFACFSFLFIAGCGKPNYKNIFEEEINPPLGLSLVRIEGNDIEIQWYSRNHNEETFAGFNVFVSLKPGIEEDLNKKKYVVYDSGAATLPTWPKAKIPLDQFDDVDVTIKYRIKGTDLTRMDYGNLAGSGVSYYIVVTAFNTKGKDSEFSNEIKITFNK